jgi:DNA-binding cell septation regulator SpoVG
MTLTIDEVNIAFIKPRNGLVGFASLTINESLYLGSIGIHQKLDGTGYRLTYPTKQQVNIYHPINKPASLAIEKAVMKKLKDVMSKCDVGYDSYNDE